MTVVSGSRRVDLAVPAAVPVAELLPELARRVGLIDRATGSHGHRLATVDGRVLEQGAGLDAQGVEAGALLVVVGGVEDDPVPAYDDPAEAVADAVAALPPWTAAAARRTALASAGLLLVLGAAGIGLERGSVTGGIAAAVAGLLVAAVLGASRAPGGVAIGVVTAWLACLYAAVSGWLLLPPAVVDGMPAGGAAAGATMAGLCCIGGVREYRELVLPVPVAGSVFLAAALVVRLTPLDAAVVIAVVLVVVVLAGGALPWLALEVAGLSVESDLSDTGPAAVDSDRAAAAVRFAHGILVGASTAVGLVLVLAIPFAVSLGPAGTTVGAMCSLLVLLRARHHHAGGPVLVGLGSGLGGLLSTATAVLFLQPSWRPGTAVALVVAGMLVLALALGSIRPSARLERMCDLGETAASVSLAPLLVVALGVFAQVWGR